MGVQVGRLGCSTCAVAQAVGLQLHMYQHISATRPLTTPNLSFKNLTMMSRYHEISDCEIAQHCQSPLPHYLLIRLSYIPKTIYAQLTTISVYV